MKLKSLIVLVLGVGALTGIAFADVAVTNVSARQRYPWNSLIDITYTISGDVASLTNPTFFVTAIDNNSGCTYLASTFTVSPALTVGTHTATWDPSADGLKINSNNVTFKASLVDSRPLYCLINVSGGASATQYPVTYLNSVPNGGWTNKHKKDYIVFRYCPAGTFMMQGDRKVTLTKPFYMGIFEVTIGQYKNVMGSASGFWNMSGDYNPTSASYSKIRGANNWPTSASTGANSFVGKLMSKTSLKNIDLPTEAQWEYACRAGTTGELNSGKGLNSKNVKEVACVYEGSIRTDNVGLHTPNSWDLYDMHGNAPEMCLDFYVADLGTKDAVDPKGATSGVHAVFSSGKNERVIRGYGQYPNGGLEYLPEGVSQYSSCVRGSTNCQCDSATCGKWECAFRICMTLEN